MGSEVATSDAGAKISYASSYHEDFPPENILNRCGIQKEQLSFRDDGGVCACVCTELHTYLMLQECHQALGNGRDVSTVCHNNISQENQNAGTRHQMLQR